MFLGVKRRRMLVGHVLVRGPLSVDVVGLEGVAMKAGRMVMYQEGMQYLIYVHWGLLEYMR